MLNFNVASPRCAIPKQRNPRDGHIIIKIKNSLAGLLWPALVVVDRGAGRVVGVCTWARERNHARGVGRERMSDEASVDQARASSVGFD